MAEERSISDVLQDILRNVQEMVRSEMRLAKVEIREEVRRAISSSVWIAAGAEYEQHWSLITPNALATWMPMWAATLVVSVVMAASATVLIMGGIRRAKRIQAIPERTVESVKENLEWMKQPTK